MEKELTKLEKDMIEKMIELVEKSETEETIMSYKDLSSEFGIRQDHIGKQLGHIAEFCFDIGVPPISAIVVNIETKKPGSGLYEVLKDKPKDCEEYIEEAQRCKDWSKLKKYL